MKIENISGAQLVLPIAGLSMYAGEIRDTSDIGTEEFLKTCTDEFVELSVTGKVRMLKDDGLTELTTTEVVTGTSGSVQTLALENVEELAVAISPHSNRRFIFLKDSMYLRKNNVIKKPFPGSVANISIRPTKASVIVQVYSDGIYFQEEEIGKNEVFEYEFEYNMTDVVVLINTDKNNTIEMYIDGNTYLDTADIQELVDAWGGGGVHHSDLDKYLFDEL